MWVDDNFRHVFCALEECRSLMLTDEPLAGCREIVLDDIERALASLRVIADAVATGTARNVPCS